MGEQSETCSRLSAAAKRSLPHCVTVLVSYEKRQLERFAITRTEENDARAARRLEQLEQIRNSEAQHSYLPPSGTIMPEMGEDGHYATTAQPQSDMAYCSEAFPPSIKIAAKPKGYKPVKNKQRRGKHQK